MKLQLIRNATLRLDYGGHLLLYDPMLGPKGSLPSFAGRSLNPTVDLPLPAEEVVSGVEAVLLSHLHSDHFDETARQLLPHKTPLLAQPEDCGKLKDWGFTEVIAVETETLWREIRIIRLPARHGLSNAMVQEMGAVSGYLLSHPNEPTLYLSGDTVWFPKLAHRLAKLNPEVAVLHAGGAVWNGERILMDENEVRAACKALPSTQFVATHLEALDHCPIERTELARTTQADCGPRMHIPNDGAHLVFEKAP